MDTTKLQQRVAEVVKQHGEAPWTERVIVNETCIATLICSPPRNNSRHHYHPENDEFWIVMGGELLWEIGDDEPINAKERDIMQVPKGVAHNIRTIGDGPSLRLAIGIEDVPYVHSETGEVFT